MNDLTVSMPSAPAPLDPRFAAESPGVSSPAIIPSPFALAIVPFLLAVHYANSTLDRLFYDTEQFWVRLWVKRSARIGADRDAGERGRRATRGV